jgi:hypothetical protein
VLYPFVIKRLGWEEKVLPSLSCSNGVVGKTYCLQMVGSVVVANNSQSESLGSLFFFSLKSWFLACLMHIIPSPCGKLDC